MRIAKFTVNSAVSSLQDLAPELFMDVPGSRMRASFCIQVQSGSKIRAAVQTTAPVAGDPGILIEIGESMDFDGIYLESVWADIRGRIYIWASGSNRASVVCSTNNYL